MTGIVSEERNIPNPPALAITRSPVLHSIAVLAADYMSAAVIRFEPVAHFLWIVFRQARCMCDFERMYE